MEKIVITYDGKNIKFDLGEQEMPIFELINILSTIIQNLSKIGFEKEKERWEHLVLKSQLRKLKKLFFCLRIGIHSGLEKEE